ncbi:MAG: HAMP domain-containing histidine kinase [Deltaproteobacteria bacterium]|nr:HAMP domain-containing histidine kinase [Deltaproteobacteria bacterium]
MTCRRAEAEAGGSVDNVADPTHRVVNHFLHDFLGGLSSVIMQIEALRDGTFGEVSPGQDRRLGRAVDDCERMVALIQDYRDATQMLEGAFRPEAEVLEPAQLVADLRAELEATGARRGLVARLSVHGRLPRARVATSLVRRLVVRLVRMLASCTRPGGEMSVEIGVENGDGPTRLVVAATAEGVEFDHDALQSTLDEHSQATHGVQIGRGYAMVFALAATRCVGGELRLGPWPGRGTRVDLSVPLERL